MRFVEPIFAELVDGNVTLRSPRALTTLRLPLSQFERLVENPLELEARDRDRLFKEGWLVPNSSEDAPPPWDSWGNITWLFHSHTSKTRFISRERPSEIETWQAELKATPRPTPTYLESLKSTGSPLMLPRARPSSNRLLVDVMERRRTHRTFTGASMDVGQLSDLLLYGFGPVRYSDSLELGTLEMRVPLSGGAIHETSAIVMAQAIRGVQPGVYIYDQVRHALAPIPDCAIQGEIESLIFEQGFSRQSAVSLLSVADAARLSWKYRDGRAYRIMLMNAGCVAQVLGLVAESLGLGMAVTAAIDECRAQELLRLSAEREFAMFLFCFGVPLLREDGLPDSFRDARSEAES